MQQLQLAVHQSLVSRLSNLAGTLIISVLSYIHVHVHASSKRQRFTHTA
jgi:hypothetical protein